jgi:hypothetical protein
MSIIKETLVKAKEELRQQIIQKENESDAQLTSDANSIASNIDKILSEFNIKVSSTQIEFKLTVDSWYDFRISRGSRYMGDEETYTKATINNSSISDANEQALKKLIALGTLAQHCLSESDEWKSLVSLMDKNSTTYKENIGPLYTKMYKIDDEIKQIDKLAADFHYKNIFDSGKMKLSEKVDLYYGSGKWDKIHSDSFEWNKNDGGKTYTVTYDDQVRTNSFYNEAGDEWIEPTYERVKRTVSKRIRLIDLQSFIKSQLSKVTVE